MRWLLRAALIAAALAALVFQLLVPSLKPRSTDTLDTAAMDVDSELEFDMPGVLRMYKTGRVERFDGTDTVPPSASGDPATVFSKDVELDQAAGISARLYLPPSVEPGKKLPVVLFFHGGAFMVHTAASPLYHRYAASLAAAVPAVVSANYRLAPEHPVPAAYDDALAAISGRRRVPPGRRRALALRAR
ncbi:hypothetical protein GUJ93_ZPchr0009g409 [Zizania palustris]|uniref:Alpha/beta hydrolase fold-3 domain-containing protein n=1 Tax=Zizania palustris TaxID=103762 RepID=A0A8J5S4Q7_ZIZPA|nr:hypothetical protein GUJ93_ZPchr0009g409 [Zizania palustris]